ncbi:TPA: autotransporter outer membrane beta-barrel domain-containing protein [Morganella morganii]
MYGAELHNYSTFVNQDSGIINIAQDSDGNAIKNNNSGSYATSGVVVNTNSTFTNNGTINLSTASNGAYGVKVNATGSAINNGTISLNGDGVDKDGNHFLAATNIGMFANGNGASASNNGTINVRGSNNIGLQAGNGATITHTGGILNIQGGVNEAGLANYGAVADGGTVDFSGGEVNLSGDHAMGMVAKNGGTIRLSGDGQLNFSDGDGQIGYLINGAGASFVNSGTGSQDITSDNSTLIRLDAGASLTGTGASSYAASGDGSVIILASGNGSSVNAGGMTLTAGGEDSVAVRVEGGAQGVLDSTTSVVLTGNGAVAGIADGEGTNILGGSTGIKAGTVLTSSATLFTDVTGAVGYIAKNTATLINSGDITLNGNNSVAVQVMDGSAGSNTGNITLGGQGSIGLQAVSTGSTTAKTTLTNTGNLTLNGSWDGSNDATRTTGVLASGSNVGVTVGDSTGAPTLITLNGDGAVGIKAQGGSQVTVNGNTGLIFADSGKNQVGFWIDGQGTALTVESDSPVVANGTDSTLFMVTGAADLTGDMKLDLNLTPPGTAGDGVATGILVSGTGSSATLGQGSQINLGDNSEAIRVVSQGTATIEDGAQFTLQGSNAVVGNVIDGLLTNGAVITTGAGTENTTAFRVGSAGTLNNTGDINLSAGQNHTAITVNNGTVSNSGNITASGIALDIQGSQSLITNSGNIEATDGTAAVRVGAGASLDLASVTGQTAQGTLKADGSADGILLQTGAAGLNVADTRIEMGNNAAGAGINNQAGIDITLDNTVINAQAGGSGILMTGGTLTGSGAASEINVVNGTGIRYQDTSGGALDRDIALSGDLTVNVAGTGSGVSAQLTGDGHTADLGISVNVTTAQGGYAADISGAQTVNNSGTLISASQTGAVLSVNDAAVISNSGTITAAGAGNAAVMMSNPGDKTFTNTGVITGSLDFGTGNNTLNLAGGTVTGNLRADGGNNTLLADGGSVHTGNISLTGSGNQTVTADAGAVIGDVTLGTGTNTVQLSGTLGNFTGQDGGNNTVTVSGAGASFTTLDAGRGTANTLNFDSHEYTLTAADQDAVQHFDTVNLENGSVLTLQTQLLMTAAGTVYGGLLNISDGAALVIDGPGTLAHALTGTGDIDVLNTNDTFDFAATAGSQFAGNVGMNAGTFGLSGDNTTALTNATLILRSDNTTQTGAGRQQIGGLTFDGGRLAFDIDTLGSSEHFVTGTVGVNHLDMSGSGEVQLNYAGGNPGFDTTAATSLPLLDQQDEILTQLIFAQTVSGAGGDLTFVDKDGNRLSALQQHNITEGSDGIVAVADYNYRATNGENNDGLYLGYGLTQLDIQAGKTLHITTAGANEKNLSAKVTGTGDLGVVAGNGGEALTISNQGNDYTGSTLVQSGTLILGNDGVLGNTKALNLAAGTTVLFSDGNGDYTQTVGELNTAGGSGLDLAGGALTVTQGGEVSGTLSGTGTLTITGNPDNTALTVNSANTGFGGTVTVDTAGELILTDISGIGSSLLTLSDGQATLAGTSGTFTNTMTGAGTLTASQGSAVTLGNDNRGFTGTLATETGSSLTVTTQNNAGGTTAVHNDGQFIVSNAGGDITLAAAVSGSGDLIKTEGNTLVLSGDNTYTGTLTVQEGTVAVSADRNLGDAAARTILDGGDLRITDNMTGERTVTLAQNGGAVLVDGGKTASLSGWDYADNGLNQAGGVAFTKDGTGTLILTGDNRGSNGDVQVDQGILQVNSTQNLGSETGRVILGADGILLMAQQPSDPADVMFARSLSGSGTLRADLAAGDTAFDFAATADNGGLFTGQLDLVNGQFTFSDTNDAVLTNATLKLSGSGGKTGTAYLNGDHTIGGLAMNGGNLVVDYGENSFTADGHLTVTDILDVSGGGNVVIGTPDNLPVPSGDIDSDVSFFDQIPAVLDYIVTNAGGKDTIGAGSQLGLVDSNGDAISQDLTVGLSDAQGRAGDAVYDYGAFVDNKGIGVGYGLTELRADKNKQILITDKGAVSDNRTLGVKLTGEGGFDFVAQEVIQIGNAASSYTGVSNVTNGTVVAITDNAFGQTSALNVNPGAVVDFNGNSQTTGSLSIGSGGQVMLSENTINGKVTELTVTDGGKVSGQNALTGRGQLAVTGGNLVIDDNNSRFTGQTRIAEDGQITLTAAPQGLGLGGVSVEGELTLQGTRGSLLNSLSGQGTVSLTDNGNILLNADNQAFGGVFDIREGVLTAADSKNTGTADILIGSQGTFTADNTADSYWLLTNQVSGEGTLVKQGQGILAVNDSNVSVGQLDIRNGIVFAGETASAGEKANLTAGTVNVMQGGALGGYGTVTGNVNNSGDIFAGSAFNGWTSPVTGEAGKLTLDGNYSSADGNIFFSGVLNGDNDSRVDRLSITGDASGNSNVYVNNIGGRGAQTEQGIQLIDIGGNYQGASFTLKGRAVAGAYEYFLYQGDSAGSNMNNWYLRSEDYVPGGGIYRPETGSYISNLATANTLFDNRLYDRTGGGFVTDPVTGERYTTSLWLRNVNGRNHWKTGNGQITSDTNRYLIQMGGDVLQTELAGGTAHLGVMAGYGRAYGTSSSGVTKYQSKSELSGYSTGVYGTWFEHPETQTGGYADTWVQYNWFDNTVKGDELGDETYKSRGITASAEAGYSFLISETQSSAGQTNRWFIQPQAQITYHGVSADDHTERNGTRVSGSGEHNIRTRLGVKVFGLGHAAQDEGQSREFKPFAEVNWLHNTRDYGVSLDGQTISQSGARNIAEVKAGIEGQLNRSTEIWGSVGVQMGGNGYNDTQAVLGVKYRF